MGATCTVLTWRNSRKFLSESNKKELVVVLSKIQVSYPGLSWPSCYYHMPVEDGTYYGITHGGGAGGVQFFVWSISQNYTSYGYEVLWVDRSHQGDVQCTWTLNLACLIFELMPFVYFRTWILAGAYLENYNSYGYEISWMVTTWGRTGVACNNLLPMVPFRLMGHKW